MAKLTIFAPHRSSCKSNIIGQSSQLFKARSIPGMGFIFGIINKYIIFEL